MATLIDTLRSFLTPELLSKASTALGESQGNVSRGLGAALPTILAGFLAKSSDAGAMQQIMDLLMDRGVDLSAARNPGELMGTGGLARSPLIDLGSRFLSSIFGAQTGAVASAVAGNAGLQPSAGSTLLGIAAPLVMSVLGDRVRRDGLNATGLASLLSSERASILKEVPAGVTSLLGLGRASLSGLQDTYRDSGRTWASWVGPAVLAGLLAVAGLWLLRDRRAAEQLAQAPAGQTASRSVTDLPDVVIFTRTLPSNYQLSAPANGIEKQVVLFIEDSGKPVDPTTWFNFDRLLFETGSAKLKPESTEQLRNVAEILKAYPAVKVKIGGYTDNTGDPDANLKLSQDRATNVMNELIILGVPAERLSAEGYGQQYPIADNATDAGRQQNRRIALRVTQK
jgi:outer membrane protein OmpA-like peptidoglycan-associated protein